MFFGQWKIKTAFERIVFGVSVGVGIFTIVFGSITYITTGHPFILWCSIGYVALLIALPVMLKYSGVRPQYNLSRLLALAYVALVGDIVLNGFGALGWYRILFHYDDFVHFVSPILGLLFFSFWGLARLERVEKYTDAAPVLWRMTGLVFLFALIWEPGEIFLDYLFHVQTYGQDGQALDTFYDICMDVAGILAGRIIAHFSYKSILRWLRENPRF